MKEITSEWELDKFKVSGTGWIVNQRDDGVKVHEAGCSYVSSMSPKFRKFHFEDKAEAKEWLNQMFGNKWYDCGQCHPHLQFPQ